MAINN
ncbi:hypothetical protein LINGRAHAP2_LOCUS15911 [Linum grandiflorum]